MAVQNYAPFQIPLPTMPAPAPIAQPAPSVVSPDAVEGARGIAKTMLEGVGLVKAGKSLWSTGASLFGGEAATTVGTEVAGEVATPNLISATSIPTPAGALGVGPAAGIVAGGLLIAKGAKDLFTGKETSGLEGWGGRISLGIATGGISEIARGLGIFGGGNKWKMEGDRIQSLIDSGVEIPDELLAGIPTGPRSKDELIRKDLPADFVGKDSEGNWVNNKFAQSRDENDLSAEDKWGYAAFYELFPDWLKKSEEERRQIAAASKVSEHHGTIDINNKEELTALAGDIKSGIKQDNMIATTGKIMQSAGISYKPIPGAVEAGTDGEGNILYASPELINDKRTIAGQQVAGVMGATMNAMYTFSPEESAKIRETVFESGDTGYINQLDEAHKNNDVKSFINILGQTERVGYTGFNMYNTWGAISPAQKSIMIAGAKMQDFTFDDGKDIYEKNATPDIRGAPNLTIGEGLKLAGNKVNVAPLTKKWDQFTAIQETMYPTMSGIDVARTASEMGMLGMGINGEAVQMSKKGVEAMKGRPVPQYGIGAITIPNGQGAPQGYSKVAELDGQTVIVPVGNERTVNVSTPETAQLASMKIYNNWKDSSFNKPEKGVYGGSAMIAGLDKLDAANPQSLSGVMAYTTYKNAGVKSPVGDLTYVAQSAGVTLNRLMKGESSRETDSKGMEYRVAGTLNEAAFNTVAKVMRSEYATNGITSKEAAYQLANQGFAEGRFNESELVTMQRNIDLIFDDNGYQASKKMLAGRNKGMYLAFKRDKNMWSKA